VAKEFVPGLAADLEETPFSMAGITVRSLILLASTGDPKAVLRLPPPFSPPNLSPNGPSLEILLAFRFLVLALQSIPWPTQYEHGF
jgi:hypothetical protein